MKIVVLGAQPEYLSGLRGPLIRDLLAAGHDVTAIGAEEMVAVRTAIESWGARYRVVPIRRAGLNPIADLGAILSLYRALRDEKPDLLFTYTVKPNVYGLPLGWLAGIKRRYGMVAGRGWAFGEGRELKRRISRTIAILAFRFGFRFADGVISQNEEDLALFRELGIIKGKTRTTRVFGSGVDLEHFQPEPMPPGAKTFVMICRLLVDKGVADYAEAGRIVRRTYPNAVFRLVGPFDHSPNGITPETIQAWADEGIIDYAGATDDVRPFIASAHALVLPTRYGEGVPRTVLEAMAMGRPVIVSDTPGCRDTVRNSENGHIVAVGDVAGLAQAMTALVADDTQLAAAGRASRALAVERFDSRAVNAAMIDFMGLKGDQA